MWMALASTVHVLLRGVSHYNKEKSKAQGDGVLDPSLPGRTGRVGSLLQLQPTLQLVFGQLGSLPSAIGVGQPILSHVHTTKGWTV